MGKLSVIPMDIVLFVAFVAYCLFFRKRELGLIGTFVFVYYLGFIFAKAPFVAMGGEDSSWVYVFGLAGLGLICLFLIGFANKQSVSPVPETEAESESQIDSPSETQTESSTELQTEP